MDLTGNSKQPWGDWVKGRERQLEVFTSIAKMRIDEGLRQPGGMTLDKWELRKLDSLFWRQPETASKDTEQPRPHLRRSPLSKSQLNQSSQFAISADTTELLSHQKSVGTAAQKEKANFVTTEASASTTCYTTFSNRKHVFTETKYGIIETSHSNARKHAVESVESDHGQFDYRVGSSKPQTQISKLSALQSAEGVRASISDYRSEPVPALSESLHLVDSVIWPSEEMIPNRNEKESDRPTITWLKDAKENALAVRNKTHVVCPRHSHQYSESSKDFASNSRKCAACDDSVIFQHVHKPELVRWRVRKNVGWHSPRSDKANRDHVHVRQREKTRTGLSCQLLGETTEPERQERPSRDRRNKSESCAVDLRWDLQKKSSTDISRTEQQQMPLVVTFEQLLMALLSDEDEVRQVVLSPLGSLKMGSSRESPSSSSQCEAEEVLLKASQWSGRHDDVITPPHSQCRWTGAATFNTVGESPHEVFDGEPIHAYVTLPESLFEPYDLDEDNDNLNRRVIEMQSTHELNMPHESAPATEFALRRS